jgi:hypothetical protein
MSTTKRRVRTPFVLAIASAIVAVSITLVSPTPASASGTSITLTGPVTPAVTYEAIIFEGEVSPAGALPRVIFQQEVAGGWHDLSGWQPDREGSFEAPFSTTARGTYRLRARSVGGSVLSNVIEVVVKPHPTEITASVFTGGRDVVVGQKLRVAGNVVEPTATPRVVVQRKVNGKWSDRAAGPVNAKGEFSIGITPTQVGRYELRVRSNGGSAWSRYPIVLDVAPKPVP